MLKSSTKNKVSSFQKIMTSRGESNSPMIKSLNQYNIDLIYKRIILNYLIKDMTYNLNIWRQIRGYPKNGNTTHTNAKMSRKNKIFFHYRLNQFYQEFGEKKRNVYPTLIKAEYNNRLWFYNWYDEWIKASYFVGRVLSKNLKKISFNPALLAQNQTNGYPRVGKAAKIGKAKKLVNLFTIGVPLYFTRYIYFEKLPEGFKHRLFLKDEVNKKLGKKIKRKLLTKKKKK